MLQLNSQAVQAALAQSGDGRLGGGVREATEQPVIPSAGQSAPAGAVGDFAALQAATLEALEQVAVQDAVEPLASQVVSVEQLSPPELPPQLLVAIEVPPETITEQWLLGMLNQRAVQVEARDGGEGAQASVLPSLLVAAQGLQIEVDPMGGHGLRSAQLEVRDGDAAVRPLADIQAPVYSGLSMAVAPGLPREADPSPASEVPGAALVQVSANMAKPQVEALTLKSTGPEPLDGQLLAQLERLSGQAAAAPAEASSASAGPGQTAQAPGLERTLKLQAPEVKWGEQMLHALRESVELQLQQRVQHTTIRLDPPELGSLEIFLSHESGRLSVQISAAQGDVARLLQQTSERLRQELVGQNFMQVSVQVSADGQPGQPHERQARARLFDEEPVMAGSLDAEPPEQGSASRSSDVLITV